MDDDSCEENQKSAKELEDEKRAEKEAQQKLVSKTTKQKEQEKLTQIQQFYESGKICLFLFAECLYFYCPSFQDDIALLVCIIVIMALTVFVVVFKVKYFIAFSSPQIM